MLYFIMLRITDFVKIQKKKTKQKTMVYDIDKNFQQ